MQTKLFETWKGYGVRQNSEGKRQPSHRVTVNFKEGSLEQAGDLPGYSMGNRTSTRRPWIHINTFILQEAVKFIEVH